MISRATSASRSRSAQELADRLRAHAALEVDAEAVRRAEASFSSRNISSLTIIFGSSSLKSCHVCSRRATESTAASRASRRGLDVLVHLADLQRPLRKGVEVLLLGALAQAEVVASSLTAAGSLGLGWSRTSLSRRSRGRAPSRGSSRRRRRRARVLALELLAAEEGVAHLVHVLRDRALLGAGRLVGLLASGASASRIWTAALPTASVSRGASRRSSRTAVERTSSRIFFESSVVTVCATSVKMPPASARPPRRWAAPAPRPRRSGRGPQNSSSSSKLRSLPLVKYSRRRESRPRAREPRRGRR